MFYMTPPRQPASRKGECRSRQFIGSGDQELSALQKTLLLFDDAPNTVIDPL